jgi:pyridoxal 5'-phosphate synthase pdxT subunit
MYRVQRKPVWGTCAGLILLAETATRTKQGGQDLIGGLDVRVNRNHFGRQTESFTTNLELPFLNRGKTATEPFNGIFIRAPIVEKILPTVNGEQREEGAKEETVIAPFRDVKDARAAKQVNAPVEVMARLPNRTSRLPTNIKLPEIDPDAGDIIAVKQGNVFGTSFHPELTKDPRIHVWWLEQVKVSLQG